MLLCQELADTRPQDGATVRAAATSDDSPEAHDAPEADDSADDAPAARSGCC